MNKSVLISIRPNWCEKILSGYKTMEIRKTRPKLQPPFKCYIYQTMTGYVSKSKENDILVPIAYGKVIGEFVCDEIERIDVPYPAYQKELPKRILKESCIPYYDLHRYAYHDDVFGWHISALKIYDAPEDLSEYGLDRPPQSWRYINR